MKLKDWLTERNIKAPAFAKLSGIRHRQLVWRYARGEQMPSPENIILIREATKGAVTADDFVDAIIERRRPAPADAREGV